METIMQKNAPVKEQLQDIIVDISWAKLAKKYFGKSPSWIYHKIDEIDGNGGTGGFTAEEKVIFKGALCDLADRIRHTADKL